MKKREQPPLFQANDAAIIEEAQSNAKSAILQGDASGARTFLRVILNAMEDLPRDAKLEAAEWGVNHSKGFEIQDEFRSRLAEFRSTPSEPQPERPKRSAAKDLFLQLFRLKPPQRPHR